MKLPFSERLRRPFDVMRHELGSRVEASLLGTAKAPPPGIVLVLSHMRSGSTLLSHLLSDHPEVLGSGEQNVPYRSEADLDATAQRVFGEHLGARARERWVYDQINHDRFLVDRSLLNHPRVKKVLLIREPLGALSSMLQLQGVKWYWTLDNALSYYTSRLQTLAEYAESLDDPSTATLLTYEELTTKPDLAFERLASLLNVRNEFSVEYTTRWFTNLRGDPGDVIREGRIVTPPPSTAPLDPVALAKATEVHRDTRNRIEEALRGRRTARRLLNAGRSMARRACFDRHIGLDRTVVLAGVGRSGTTFVSNLINHQNRYRVVFEPFREPQPDAPGFEFPLYLRRDAHDPERSEAARHILSGRVHSEWIDCDNRAHLPRARLVKEIRACFFLPWMQAQFPQVKLVLLLRHPCAVARSWLAAGFGDGSAERERLLACEDFVRDMPQHVVSAYRDASTPLERIAFLWGLSTLVPLRQCSLRDMHVMFYENVLLAPEREMRRVCELLAQPYDEPAMRSALATPSSSTCKTAAELSDAANNVVDWRHSWSSPELDSVQAVLELLGLNSLYDAETGLPSGASVEDLRAFSVDAKRAG